MDSSIPPACWTEPAAASAALSIPALVAEVYDAAPPAERRDLVATLMRPLGVLSLAVIADGVFARIRLRSGWPDPGIGPEDIGRVHPAHIVALVDHAQQVSVETVDGLAQWLMASPTLSGTAAATLLVALLLNRARGGGPPPPAVRTDVAGAT